MDQIIQLPNPQVVPPVSSSDDVKPSEGSFNPMQVSLSDITITDSMPTRAEKKQCFVNKIRSYKTKSNNEWKPSSAMSGQKIKKSLRQAQTEKVTLVQEVKERFKKTGTRTVILATFGSEPREWNLTVKKKSLHTMSIATSNLSREPSATERGRPNGSSQTPKLEAIPAKLISDVHAENDYKKVSLNGTPFLRQKLTDLVVEFKDIFQCAVPVSPAKLTPFELKVSDEKWRSKKNQQPCLKRDIFHERELEKTIKVLIKSKQIEECNEPYYSQVHMVPKYDGTWRLVSDSSNLNSATILHYTWPIPHISDILSRVGASRPNFFAAMTLTGEFQQALISEETRKYTAFATHVGVYRWLRLPAGLTEAASWFQHSLSTQVLNGLPLYGNEIYLNECMVHATTQEQYIDRLRTALLRFRDSGITINPSKCSLGLSQIEFMGHTIKANGQISIENTVDTEI